MIEERIVSFSIAHPGLGPRRVASELAREKWGGIVVSANGAWKVLCRHGLNTRLRPLHLPPLHRAEKRARHLPTLLQHRPRAPRTPHTRTHPRRHRLPCPKDGGKMSRTCRHISKAAQPKPDSRPVLHLGLDCLDVGLRTSKQTAHAARERSGSICRASQRQSYCSRGASG
jgi:hypothetical protein